MLQWNFKLSFGLNQSDPASNKNTYLVKTYFEDVFLLPNEKIRKFTKDFFLYSSTEVM